MQLRVTPSLVSGEIIVPTSATHTMHALVCASLCTGRSVLSAPSFSPKTRSLIQVLKGFGSNILTADSIMQIDGFGNCPQIPQDIIDIEHPSSLYFGMAIASLVEGTTLFTGDASLRKRSVKPLIDNINQLGAKCWSTLKNGTPPLVVQGHLVGGNTFMDASYQEQIMALLLCIPLAYHSTTIHLTYPAHFPNIHTTIFWYEKLGVNYQHQNMHFLEIDGNQSLRPFSASLSGDFFLSSVFALITIVTQGHVQLDNLDNTTPEQEQFILNALEKMCARITRKSDSIIVHGAPLIGDEFDLASCPEAFPILSVAGCFAHKETRLYNLNYLRHKSIDVVRLTTKELIKLGADITEFPNEVIIRHSPLKGGHVYGHNDPRIIFSLIIASLFAKGETIIHQADALAVEYPSFIPLCQKLGVHIEEQTGILPDTT